MTENYTDAYMNRIPAGAAYAGPQAGNVDGGQIGWNDQISDDGEEMLILPEGDYQFEVVGFERGWHERSEKLDACNMAVLQFKIVTPEGVARARTNLFLLRKMEFKITAFLRSINQKEKGKAIQMDWNRVLGAVGRAHFRPRTYNGQEFNELIRFLDYDPEMMKQVNTGGSAPMQGAMPAQGAMPTQGFVPTQGAMPMQGQTAMQGSMPRQEQMSMMSQGMPRFTYVSGSVPIPF